MHVAQICGPGLEQEPHCCVSDAEKFSAERAEACEGSLYSPEGKSGVAAAGRKELLPFRFLV